jgi:nicotinamide-nucleotide amidase
MDHQLQSVLRYLEENRLTLVTAESCTAGLVASRLAEMPGSGSWLDCAFVTYSKAAKMRCLGVRRESIEQHNLTSEPIAREMAEGALHNSRANLAIATTGVAGPDDQGEIPAGTVCFAWAFEHDQHHTTFSETRKFEGDRSQVMESATDYALSRIWHYHQKIQESARNAAA